MSTTDSPPCSPATANTSDQTSATSKQNSSFKPKKIPPKAPPKPSSTLLRKASDEEEILKQLDKILENAFDFGAITEEADDDTTPPQVTSMTSSTSSDSASSNKNRLSSGSSWRSNRNSDVFTADVTPHETHATGARSSATYPEEPEPDYDVNGKLSKDPGDSGISDPGSLDDLNKDEAEQEPDYANVEFAQQALKRVSPQISKTSTLQKNSLPSAYFIINYANFLLLGC